MIRIALNPEVLRRIAALAGLLLAIWFFVWPAEYVYSVSLVNFQTKQQKERWKDERNMPLAQYVAQEVKGRLKKVSGPQWQELLVALLKAQNGDEPQILQGRKYTIGSRYPDYYYFGPQAQPMASLDMPTDGFTYLTMTMDGRRYFLSLNSQPYRWADHAPNWMLFPTRDYAWLPLVLGLAAYLFIPQRKKPEGAYTYSRFSAQILVDVLGLLFTGFFFALPLLIIPNNAGIWDVFSFDGGWGVLTLIFWVPLAGCGLAMLGIAARYASTWLHFGPDTLTKAGPRGVKSFAYADMQYAEPYQRKAPRWLVWGLMFLGAGNPTAMGQAMLIQSNVEFGYEIRLNDKRAVRVMFNSLAGADELPGVLAAAGVEVRLAAEN